MYDIHKASKLNENKKRKNSTLLDGFNDFGKIDIDDILENEENKYPMSAIEELANSILQFGLLQDIIVKKQENGYYVIIAGHRRYNAHKLLYSQGYEEYKKIGATFINENEDEIITRIKLHETNLQTRPLNKMSEEEKNKIISEYIELIDFARKNEITIKGKPVKGKTRDILADMLGISPRTAGKLISEQKGGKIATPKKNIPDNLYIYIEAVKSKLQENLATEVIVKPNYIKIPVKSEEDMNILLEKMNSLID